MTYHHTENPYHAFPLEMRGTYCEFKDKAKLRFLEIHHIKYDQIKIESLRKMNSLEESEYSQYINLVDKDNITSETYYLYKIQTYLGDPTIKDAWIFNEAISEYKEYGFSKFSDLISFCDKKWSVTLDDFVCIEDTHIPYK